MITYIDMDGVIADFRTWMQQYIPDIQEEHWKKVTHGSDPWKVMDDNVDEIYRDFGTLDLLPMMNQMYNHLPNTKFLSAIPRRWHGTPSWDIAKENKLTWLEKHIDNFVREDAIFAKGSGDKVNYLKPGDVLYDDLEGNIKKWNREGGIGIHVEGRRSQA